MWLGPFERSRPPSNGEATGPPDRAPARAAEGELPSGRWARIIERGLLVAGLVLFAVLLHETGTRVVVDNIRLVGWGIGLMALQEVLAYASNSLGWWYALPQPRPAIAFPRLLAVRLAGDPINCVTLAPAGGGESGCRRGRGHRLSS